MTRQQMQSLSDEIMARRRERERLMALQASRRARREKFKREAEQTAPGHASRVGA